MSKSIFKLSVVALSLTFSVMSFASELTSCQEQLKVKDMQIESLIRASINSTPGTLVVTTSSSYVCEAVCIHELVGAGWNQGVLKRSSVIIEGNTVSQAFQSLLNKCDSDNKEIFKSANAPKPGRYASSNVAGIMTKNEINSTNWEANMVKSFNNVDSYRKFCRKN